MGNKRKSAAGGRTSPPHGSADLWSECLNRLRTEAQTHKRKADLARARAETWEYAVSIAEFYKPNSAGERPLPAERKT